MTPWIMRILWQGMVGVMLTWGIWMVLEGLKTPSHFCVYVTNSDCYIYIYIFWKWRSRSCQNCLFHAGRNVSQNHCILLANCKPCALKTLAAHRDNNTKSSNVMMQKGFQTLPLSITACQLRRDFWKLHPRTWHEKIPKNLVRHKKDIEFLDSLLFAAITPNFRTIWVNCLCASAV